MPIDRLLPQAASGRRIWLGRLVAAIFVGFVMILLINLLRGVLVGPARAAPGDLRVPFAVLGDSDSHGYRDRLSMPGRDERGGRYRDTTYQWTEVLATLRGDELDFGPFGTWGTRGKVATLLAWLGVEVRAPMKQDHRFNFALSGAECDSLLGGPARQTERLLRLMRDDSARWAHGVVVIRIGVNSVGKQSDLDTFARTGLDTQAEQRLAECLEPIRRSVAMIRAEHPRTLLVVSGISDESDSVEGAKRWPDTTARANIAAVMDGFENRLQAIVAGDPRAAYYSDRGWFRGLWTRRDAAGETVFHPVNLGGPESVVNGVGDHPRFVTLVDGHAGTVQNGLWARDLLELLRARFALPVNPITVQEVARLADPRGEYGLAPRPDPLR